MTKHPTHRIHQHSREAYRFYAWVTPGGDA